MLVALKGVLLRQVGRPRTQRSRLVWAGYLACGGGLAFAAASFYWGSGGTAGVDTVWGSAPISAAQRTTLLIAVWVTGFIKPFGALLALLLVTRWGTRLPRRPLILLGWGAAAVLMVYGGANVVGEALVATGVVRPAEPVDWKPLLWHLYVWDMFFLVWGILFGLAIWHFVRQIPRGAS